MAKPRVFVSSTYYDLKHLRSSLENFVELLGYEPILSEKGDIAYVPETPLDESCYREVKNSDIYVLIIGGRYGSEASQNRTTAQSKSFFDRYDSITKLEYESALDQDIPIYILIEKAVYADYENWQKNRDNKVFKYAHVDSINIFHLIEHILAQPRNNPLNQFDKYIEIESWLKDQWAGYFRELLKKSVGQQQLRSLSAQVSELSEINQTLKKYLEALVTKVVPADSKQLIKSESERLEEARRIAKFEMAPLIMHIQRHSDLNSTDLFNLALKHPNFDGFIKEVLVGCKDDNILKQLTDKYYEQANRDYGKARAVIGFKEKPPMQRRPTSIKKKKK